MHHLDAELATVGHVIVEALGAVMAEPVVVANDKGLDIQSLGKHLPHEFLCRERGHLLAEAQHRHVVDTCEGDELQFALKGGKQLGLVVLVEHLPGMAVEGDDERGEPGPSGLFHDIGNEKLVAAMHAIEKSYRGNARSRVAV